MKGLTDGLFLMCHSHIKDKTCFQSLNDFDSIIKYNIKYSFTMAKDGFMLVINNNQHPLNSEDYNGHVGKMEKAQEKTSMYKNTIGTYKEFSKNMDGKFYTEYVPKINDKKVNKLIQDFANGNISEDVYLNGIDKHYNEFYTSSLPNSAEDLNNVMKSHNVEVYYFPKTNKK